MTWNTAARRREVWVKKFHFRRAQKLACYFGVNNEWAIVWPIEQDREGEPMDMSREMLARSGFTLLEAPK